MIKHYQAMA